MFSFGLVQEPHIGFYIPSSRSNGTTLPSCDLIDIYNFSSFIPLPIKKTKGTMKTAFLNGTNGRKLVFQIRF